MAAEALLGAAAEAFLGALLEKIRNEFANFSGFKEKIEKLASNLELIKAVLADAEEKQITDSSIKIWLQRLKDAAYVLDDIVDECSIKSQGGTLDECSMGSLALGCLSSSKPRNIMFRRRVGRMLNKMIRRLDQIAEDKNKFGLSDGVRDRPNEVPEWRQTGPIIAQPQVYGRDEDREKVVRFLLSRGSDVLTVYPIVGLGGVGKTTLAQLVYNDRRVSTHFNLKIWVCVSENFIVRRILCSIIESITKDKCNVLDLAVMEQKVQELLRSRRYLLVLDDVWKRNQRLKFGLSQEEWNRLKAVLSCGSNGASILVTTRDDDVAAIMGTCRAHHLSGLSEDDCWLLFQQCAFGPDREQRAELVSIGKDIVRKCGGSPLAARALGGALRSKNEEKEWLEAKESRLWTLPYENDIFPALSLSYFYLTPILKQCFAFCAIFPKDTTIMKEELIHLWMANGFISSRINLDVEDVGNTVWNELCQKSFFQYIGTDYSGDVSFKMHDLIHDLAQSVAGQECMTLEDANMTDLSRSTHHVGFGSRRDRISFNEKSFEKVESLRTLYQVDLYFSKISGYTPTNRSLRVSRTSCFTLSSLGDLIHLRYLELCGDENIKYIPDSIYSLHKLEILKLVDLENLSSLPKHLTCLQNLRHLIIEDCSSLSRMFPDIRKLCCLRTLSLYIVSMEAGHSLAELHDLKLGGKLSIEGLVNVGGLSEAQEANLKGKKDLWELHLSWGDDGETKSPVADAEQVLEALQPHSNLMSLSISHYEGLRLPSWVGNSSALSNLVNLQFYSFRNCWQLQSLGRLPSLTDLTVDDVDFVQYVDDDECYDGADVSAFPSLEGLTVSDLPNLERLLIVKRGDVFPHLSVLEISDCPQLGGLPCLPSLERLEVAGCNSELLSSISGFKGLTFLELRENEDLTSFPEGMLAGLTCLKTLQIIEFTEVKELPFGIMELDALEFLHIESCDELESLPEHGWDGLRSLRELAILSCPTLRSLPEGLRHLTSLEVLHIEDCPTLIERCKEGTGEDWHKIAHIPKISID